LIIRRELAYNFVWYNKDYDSYQSLPSWAANTLKVHQNDKRKPVYGSAELERAATADPYWNAAQREMMIRGKMHGYMRMYWGKKLIEWMKTPQEAYSFALYLNNKYELDGRDPNGYAGIAWCFGKHDRAWKERPIFGKIRYMNASGLERKFAIDAYVSEISMLPEINS
jgi:deoxyribodipyrimidine photo-lyase